MGRKKLPEITTDLTSQAPSYQDLAALQRMLRRRVRLAPLVRPPRLVGGADALCDREEKRIFGAVAVYRYPDMELVEEAGAEGVCSFPYRSGFLSFREVPILAAAVARLRQPPDVLLVDGQGIAHPRGLGLASHLGLVLDLPTIGLAKSRLVGEGAEPDLEAGSTSPLRWQGKEIGLVLRTVDGRKPLYLSPGHLITLPECMEIVLGCVRKYRIPLPLRQADLLTRRLRRGASDSGTPPGPTITGRSY